MNWAVMGVCLLLIGCSTTGNLGIVTKSTVDSTSILETQTQFTELGPVKAEACRLGYRTIYTSAASEIIVGCRGWKPFGTTNSMRGPITVYYKDLGES